MASGNDYIYRDKPIFSMFDLEVKWAC